MACEHTENAAGAKSRGDEDGTRVWFFYLRCRKAVKVYWLFHFPWDALLLLYRINLQGTENVLVLHRIIHESTFILGGRLSRGEDVFLLELHTTSLRIHHLFTGDSLKR